LQPVARDGNLPLSFAQERLWFLDQLEPGTAAYNIPFAFWITGPLNVSALERSLNEILQRHEALRTTFSSVEGKPVQVIAPTLSLTLEVVDCRNFPPDQRQSQVMQLATEAAKQSFDLSRGPLFKAGLLQLDEDEHVLFLNVHHIVFDYWSKEGILVRELAALYEAFSSGKSSPLSELPIQYPDFAVWQRQWLQGEFLETLQSYWQRQLGGQLAELQLPTDYPRPAVQTRQSACQKLDLSKELTEALKTLSRQEGATLFVTLLAAFKVLLHCYTQQDDLFVCSPIANRNRQELKELIGYFVNLLVLRSDLSGDPSFRELLGRVRPIFSGAYAHQDLPLQQLVNHLKVQAPLSQVMFVLQNTPRQRLELPGLAVSSLDFDSGTADFDLFLEMVEDAGTLSGVVKYNTDLFEDATIIRMLSHFQTLLENIVAEPGQPISSLLPLTEAEKQQLLNARANCQTLPTRELARSEREKNYVAPRNSLELQLAQIWGQILGIEAIGIRDNFFELGGESMLALRLFNQIEQKFSKFLPLATLIQAPTIEQLARVLSQEGESGSSWSSLVPIQPSGSKPPFFCIHGQGANVLIFQDLARHLGPEQPFYGLQARGLDGKHAPLYRVEDMAAYYLQEVRTVQPQGPYFLGGYSLGGAIALEMAQQLHRQGEEVAFVGLLDTFGPGCFKPVSFPEQLARQWRILLRFGPEYPVKKFRKQFGKGRQDVASKIYRSLGLSLPSGMLRTSIMEAAKRAGSNYVPQTYSGHLTLFRASDLPGEDWYYHPPGMPTPDDWYTRAPQYGWDKVAGGGLEIHDIPGSHGSMLKEPQVRSLAEKLRACLEQAQAGDRRSNTLVPTAV
jgi:thioesterase domain-containing protein